MSLESLLAQTESKKPKKNSKFYLQRLCKGIKDFYKTNIAVKFKLLYETATISSDKVLTYFGIKYLNGSEANPIMSDLFTSIGMIPSAIITYFSLNTLLYLASKMIHKTTGTSDKKVLGSAYVGVGSAELLVSIHNYFIIENYSNVLTNINYTQILLPLAIIASTPVMYTLIKSYFKEDPYK